MLVALIYNTMELEVLVLTLAVLSVGMLALRQFADMRHKLELIVAERTQKLEEKTRELELQATRDNLTGLFNRRYADEYLARELETCRREPAASDGGARRHRSLQAHQRPALACDRRRGVAPGRRRRCATAAAPSDVLARYGGEEFLFCFPSTELREARLICEELRTAVEERQLGAARPRSRRDDQLRHRRVPGRHVAGAAASASADIRLYEAKNSGRNLVVA